MGKVLIAQGGGPTVVINQSMVGAVLAARSYSQVDKVYGALHGVDGIVNENFVDLTDVPASHLEDIAATPASALGSTRSKPDADFCERIFASCEKHDITTFFYVGGNDSSDTVRIVAEEAERRGYPLRCVHIPKTIDNDLMVNDHTPGFGSAARFVASAFAGVNQDNRALKGVYIAVIMGRHAGFLTAAAALARQNPGDGPHFIYLPERVFDRAKFLADIKAMHDKHGRAMVAVSEGILDETGTPMVVQLAGNAEYDAHGNVQLSGTGALGDQLVQLVKGELGIKRVRSDTFGYLQRSFLGCASDTDQKEAREVGAFAAKTGIEDQLSGSITIHRVAEYAVEYRVTDLLEIAAKTKHMPDHFINEEGNDVTEAFVEYCRPLIGTDMPRSVNLQAPRVDA
jgi:ATP-dependent phosphofructokinase / diphosphate-dependent phosphofructokinase